MGILKELELKLLQNKFDLEEFYNAMKWDFNLIDALFIGMITSFISSISIGLGAIMLTIVIGSSIIYCKNKVYNLKTLLMNIIISAIAVLIPLIF